MAGLRIAGYEIVRLLGRGGMGAVYLGRSEADGSLVAIKLAKGTLGEQGLKRLKREGELLSRIETPHLPRFHRMLETDKGLVVIMGFVDGEPLQNWIDQPVEPVHRLRKVKEIVPGIVAALRALHGAGIVHRDIKPPNVVVGPQGAALVDLGLARGPDVVTLTGTGVALGTPDYLPPEQITGEEVGPVADVYQVALLLVEMLHGYRKKSADEALQGAVRRSLKKFPDPREDHPWIPRDLAAWIVAALHPDPKLRPEAEESLQRLLEVCAQAEMEEASDKEMMPSWFESATVEDLVRSREEARENDWDVSKTPSGGLWEALDRWDEATNSFSVLSMERPRTVLPEEEADRSQKAGALPTRPRKKGSSRRARMYQGILYGGLLVIGILVGVLSLTPSGPRPADGPLPTLAFSFEDRVLRLVEGAESVKQLELLEPRAARFERDGTGYPRVALSESLEGALTAVISADGVRYRLWLPDPEQGFGFALGGRGASTVLRVPLGALEEVQGVLSGGDARVFTRGMEELRFPLGEELLSAKELTLRLRVQGGLEVIRTLELSEELGKKARDIVFPPDPSEKTFAEWGRLGRARERGGVLWKGKDLAFLNTQGPRLAALLGAGSLDEDLRAEAYRDLAPFVHAEWMWRRSPRAGGWRANRALGSLLGISPMPALVAAVEGEVDFRKDFSLQIDLGLDDETGRALSGRLPKGHTPGEFDEHGTFWVKLEGLRAGRPRRLEVGLWGVGADTWGTLLLRLLGDRTLRIPLGDATLWRFHRLPPAWYERAVSDSGRLRIGFDFERRRGYQVPGNMRVAGLFVHAVFPSGGAGGSP